MVDCYQHSRCHTTKYEEKSERKPEMKLLKNDQIKIFTLKNTPALA